MPPRRRTQAPRLGAEELVALAEAVAAGRRRTVYLRAAVPSLGLDAGASARVIRVEETTVTVRPRGVNDDVPFDATELAPTAAAAAATPTRTRARAPSRPAVEQAPAARPVRPRTSVEITLVGSGEDGWTVREGSRRAVAVPAENVARAVAALAEPTISTAVDSVLEHAREVARQRVSELSAHLQEARATLDALALEADPTHGKA